MYLDVNNLYGWARVNIYHIVDLIDNFDVNSISENSSAGYILEADLEYPDELHALHNDYPLAPEKLKISHNM